MATSRLRKCLTFYGSRKLFPPVSPFCLGEAIPAPPRMSRFRFRFRFSGLMSSSGPLLPESATS